MHAVILFDVPKKRFHTSIYTDYVTDIHCLNAQDSGVIVPPYPYCIEEDHHEVVLEDCW